jgi:prepilin-type N-terminal cleavage/methylation domain-containing protein
LRTVQLVNNQQGFTLVEFTMSLFLLAIAMLAIARWQQQALQQQQWLRQQLQVWMIAEQVIEQLAAGKPLNLPPSTDFVIKYKINWQGRCRLLSVQVAGRQQSKARLRFVIC